MDRDHVGGRQQLVELHQLNARYGRLGQRRIGGDHAHTEGVGGDGDPGADPAQPDQAQRAGVELEGSPDRLAFESLAGAGGVMRKVLGDGEDQRQRVLGSRHHRRQRRVAHGHAGSSCGDDVDVVVADPDPRDHLDSRAQPEGGVVPRTHRCRQDGVGHVELIVAAETHKLRSPVDQVAVHIGEGVVDEQQRQSARQNWSRRAR